MGNKAFKSEFKKVLEEGFEGSKLDEFYMKLFEFDPATDEAIDYWQGEKFANIVNGQKIETRNLFKDSKMELTQSNVANLPTD